MAARQRERPTREIMARVFSHAAEIIGRYEGRIEKFIGDAIMAIFGLPVAHEDDPVRAVRAALELHAAIATLSPKVVADAGTSIALHSGINTGLVVSGELQFGSGTAGPLGDTINLAARLMGAAPSGEIWVGAQTRSLVSHAFELEDLGARDFKGKAEPIAVARVCGARLRAVMPRQFGSTFVGRQAELGALLGAAGRTRGGESSVLGICGDAGTGKSRLVAEFRARVGDDVQWLEGRSYPYAQNIPYAPIIDLLSRAWGIEESCLWKHLHKQRKQTTTKGRLLEVHFIALQPIFLDGFLVALSVAMRLEHSPNSQTDGGSVFLRFSVLVGVTEQLAYCRRDCIQTGVVRQTLMTMEPSGEPNTLCFMI